MSELASYGQYPVIVQVGDIAVTQAMVYTPNGAAPIRGCIFVTTDMHTEQTKIPTWAIIMTILFVGFCGLGLLFLLAKETIVQGYVNVSVQNQGLYHVTQIPAISAQNVADVRSRVTHMQTVAQWASAYQR